MSEFYCSVLSSEFSLRVYLNVCISSTLVLEVPDTLYVILSLALRALKPVKGLLDELKPCQSARYSLAL